MLWCPGTHLLESQQQQAFSEALKNGQDKSPNLFSLLGWEASLLLRQLQNNGTGSLKGWTYDSPRGEVTIHPHTHHTLCSALLWKDSGRCRRKMFLAIPGDPSLDPVTHLRYLIAEKNFILPAGRIIISAYDTRCPAL